MARLGFYLDVNKCIGCRTCQVQCKDKNRLGIGPIFRKTADYSVGSYPNATMFHITMSCNHCAQPACVETCPVGAMYQAEDGTVQHDSELCIGCKACMTACPYGHPQYIEEKQKVGKCDSCYAIRQAGGNPACVDACVMRALDFGDLDELREKYGPELVNTLPVLPDPGKTDPSLLIKTKESALSKDAKEIWL